MIQNRLPPPRNGKVATLRLRQQEPIESFDPLVEQDDPTNGDYTNLRGVAPYHHYDTGHLDAKYFTDFNTTSNWGYTQWRNGEVEISTGGRASRWRAGSSLVEFYFPPDWKHFN